MFGRPFPVTQSTHSLTYRWAIRYNESSSGSFDRYVSLLDALLSYLSESDVENHVARDPARTNVLTSYALRLYRLLWSIQSHPFRRDARTQFSFFTVETGYIYNQVFF